MSANPHFPYFLNGIALMTVYASFSYLYLSDRAERGTSIDSEDDGAISCTARLKYAWFVVHSYYTAPINTFLFNLVRSKPYKHVMMPEH